MCANFSGWISSIVSIGRSREQHRERQSCSPAPLANTLGQGEGVASATAWLFGEQSRAIVLSGATGGGSGDWEWSGGGGVQAFDWGEIEADVGEVEGGQTQQYGDTLLTTILRPVAKILDTSKIGQENIYAPDDCSPLTCFTASPKTVAKNPKM